MHRRVGPHSHPGTATGIERNKEKYVAISYNWRSRSVT